LSQNKATGFGSLIQKAERFTFALAELAHVGGKLDRPAQADPGIGGRMGALETFITVGRRKIGYAKKAKKLRRDQVYIST
jgi:hypothetical protein